MAVQRAHVLPDHASLLVEEVDPRDATYAPRSLRVVR
jgi:hypothetical protein